MKKNKIILGLILTTMLSVSYAKDINEYLSYLGKNNLDIQKSELNYEQSILNYNGAKIEKNPSFSTSLSGNKNDSSTSYSLTSSLSYDLDIWGKLKDNEKAKILKIEIAKQNLEDTKKQVNYKFIDYYLQYSANIEKINIQEKKLGKLNEKLIIVESQIKNGYVNLDKSLLIKNNINDTENNILSLKDSNNNLLNNMNTLLNQKMGEGILEEPEGLKDIVKLNDSNENLLTKIEKNPTVKAALINTMYYDQMIDYNNKSYYPTIKIGGSLTENALKISNLLSNPIWTILSTVNFNFNFNEIDNNIQLSKLDKKLSTNSYQSTYITMFNNIKEATIKYKNADISYEKMNEEYKNSEKIVNIYSAQYKKGYLLYTNLLDQEILLLTNEDNKLSYKLTKQQMINKLNYY